MSVFLIARWLFLVWISGWLMLPFSRRIWRDRLPDGGLAVGRILFLGAATLATFWLGNMGVPVRSSAIVLWIFAACLAFLALRRQTEMRAFIVDNRRAVWASEAIFLGVFFLFFALRGFWPDVLWPANNSGEKPMDIALIASCVRAEYLPPANPYAAGTRLDSYYYFGHLQTALLSDAVAGLPRWTYNLMFATVPALCFSVLAMLCAALTKSLRAGVIGGTLILTCGTLQPVVQWLKNGRVWPLEYMETSRVIPFTINEYPWFSFNYGDLHAHLFGMPFALLSICCGWALIGRLNHATNLAARGWRWTVLLAAFALALQILTNTWDFPTYEIFLALCLASAILPQHEAPLAQAVPEKSTPEYRRTSRKNRKAAPREVEVETISAAPLPLLWRCVAVLGSALLMGLGALMLAIPFLLQLRSEATRPTLLQQPASPTTAWLLVWGVPLGAWLVHLVLVARERREENAARGAREQAFATLVGITALAVWFALRIFTGGDFCVLIVLIVMILWTAREIVVARTLLGALLARLALCGFLALLWSETTWAGFLGDPLHAGFDDFKRQDTVFKFGLQAWYLLGIASVSAALHHVEAGTVWVRRWPLALRISSVAALAVMLSGSVATTFARAQNFEKWQGWDTLEHLAPSERGAAQWLQIHARDGDTLMEAEQAQGGDYTAYTRYASASGVPAVIGPSAHSYQWGLSWGQVARRKAAVRAFYSGKDAEQRPLGNDERRSILQTYQLGYVICGNLERQEYGEEAVAQVEQLLPNAVYQAGNGQSRVSIRRAF